MLGQTEKTAKRNSVLLRKQATDAERAMWRRLYGEQLNAKFRRQHPFGSYVLDFVCVEHRLVIEIDGSQHMECARDVKRDAMLNDAGFRVLRFCDNQVLTEMDAVLEEIWRELRRDPSPPQPSP